MRRTLRLMIPSMFHRRLLLLGAVACAVFLVLFARTVGLATGESQKIAELASEKSLEVTKIIPTIRGRILDRNGLVLAKDVPGYDVAVSYDLITGEWAINNAKYATRFYIRQVLNPAGKYPSAAEEIEIYNQKLQEFQNHEGLLWYILTDLTGMPSEDVEKNRIRILENVQEDSSRVISSRERKLENLWGEEINWQDAEFRISEESNDYKHTLFRNVSEEMQRKIREMNVEAERALFEYREARRNRSDDLVEKRRAYEEMLVWSSIEVRRPRQREYPFETQDIPIDRSTLPTPLRSNRVQEINIGGVALHILGQMRNVWASDIKRRPYRDKEGNIDRGGYRSDDLTGLFGIEATMEDFLRGERGYVKKRLGEVVETLPPVPGHDVHLTIDVYLQGRIQALLSKDFGFFKPQEWHAEEVQGIPFAGSIVVLDVKTSEILAAVSAPNYTLEQYRDPKQRKLIRDDQINLPMRFRPTYQNYEPGSTVKPLIFTAAVTDGEVGPTEIIECTGVLDPDFPNRFRCWKHKMYMLNHGPISGSKAIGVSCNIFFYVLGKRLGVERITQWFERFGVGLKPNSYMTTESKGVLPDLNRRYTEGDAINMGIGQGPVNWTPIQAAAAYATIARGGQYISPTFVKPEDRPIPQATRDLNLSPSGVMVALQGLKYVTTGREGGGRYIDLADGTREDLFNHPDLDIIGKTGTADASAQRLAYYDEEGKVERWGRILKDGDHGWFISLVKRKDDTDYRYVVLAVTDYGGSGRAASGPIVNQVLHAMKAEGYLTDSDDEGSSQ